MHHVPRDTGFIEVITGCMFSGKTEELIRRLNRARYAKQRVMIFKPRIDARYAPDSVVSHSKQELTAVAIDDANEILELASDADVVGIDEAQFFGPPLVAVAERLANDGRRVVVAGLDQDYLGRPFEPMPRHLHVLRQPRGSLPAPRATGRYRGRGRYRVLRGSLPALLRSHGLGVCSERAVRSRRRRRLRPDAHCRPQTVVSTPSRRWSERTFSRELGIARTSVV